MPNIGPMELILLLAIILLVVGPGKLPEVGKSLGNAIREFRKATTDVQEPTRVVGATPPPQPAPAPNTLSGSVEPNTIAEPGSEGTPRA